MYYRFNNYNKNMFKAGPGNPKLYTHTLKIKNRYFLVKSFQVQSVGSQGFCIGWIRICKRIYICRQHTLGLQMKTDIYKRFLRYLYCGYNHQII